MFRFCTLLFATLLITAPAFAGSGGCQRSTNSADAETTEQRQDTEVQS